MIGDFGVYGDKRRGFTVWSISALTGDRKDCYGTFTDKRTAIALCRKLRRTLELPRGWPE